MRELHRQILAALAGSIVLAGISILTDYVFWFNFGISAAAALGTYFTIPVKKEAHEIEVTPGITQADVDAAVALLNGYVEKFSDLSRKCSKRSFADMIRKLSQTLVKIANNFRNNPRDLSNASYFLEQYLAKSYDIVSQYVRLTEIHSGDQSDGRLANIEQIIHKINNGFKGFYEQSLQNDLTDLEVNAETLKAIMDMNLPNLNVNERNSL